MVKTIPVVNSLVPLFLLLFRQSKHSNKIHQFVYSLESSTSVIQKQFLRSLFHLLTRFVPEIIDPRLELLFKIWSFLQTQSPPLLPFSVELIRKFTDRFTCYH